MSDAIQKVNTNEVCNSICQTSLNCPQMWSLVQYNSIYALRENNNSLFNRNLSNDQFKFMSDNPQERVKKIAELYAKMYLEKFNFSNPKLIGRFYWMALGAFAAKQVYCGVLALDDSKTKLGLWGLGKSKGAINKIGIKNDTIHDFSRLTKDDLDYLRARMLKGNLWLFLDVFAYHEYYCRFSKSFFKCLPDRNIQTYDSRVKNMVYKLPYAEKAMPQVKYFSYGADLKYIKAAFSSIQKFEKEKNINIKYKLQLEILTQIAYHEQWVVLQNCFYAPNGIIDSRLKKIFDTQKELAIKHPELMASAAYVADTQDRQAVYTNTCKLPHSVLNNNQIPAKDKELFYENMKDDEDLYDKNLRMRFILRIAKEFHQVMKKYEKNMSGYLSHIANNNIVDGAGIYD